MRVKVVEAANVWRAPFVVIPVDQCVFKVDVGILKSTIESGTEVRDDEWFGLALAKLLGVNTLLSQANF
jgi:hypothetical protein